MSLKLSKPLYVDRPCYNCNGMIAIGVRAFYYTWSNKFFCSRKCARQWQSQAKYREENPINPIDKVKLDAKPDMIVRTPDGRMYGVDYKTSQNPLIVDHEQFEHYKKLAENFDRLL